MAKKKKKPKRKSDDFDGTSDSTPNSRREQEAGMVTDISGFRGPLRATPLGGSQKRTTLLFL